MIETEKLTTKGVFVMGSSRSDGDTAKVVEFARGATGFEIIDLAKKDIRQFDYAFGNKGDDFMPTMRYIVEDFETIVFATPIYWYSMSGIMKAFIDRITDLLTNEKDLGRKLRGKSMAMISCSETEETWESVRMPFRETAGYLGMNYLGDIHAWVEQGEIPELVKRNLIVFFEKVTQDS